MATRKNVIFIGMTQNGKSSLVQQILQYAGEFEQASSVGIGTGNFSETQKCSRYNVNLPLQTHRLRQIEGPDEDRNGKYMDPGIDFELDKAGDHDFAEVVEDNGERLQLTLIDTPGLSDSGNATSSVSGMRVLDERHKLRILLTLQDVEDVHAICFVVRRDTHYGSDFQQLIQRMVSILSFCACSTAWNLQHHIIHTNIDPDDRAAGLCEDRQREFDKFGPAGAVHHFLDNKPDCDCALETFFTNNALSKFFKSLVASTPVKFSDLQYPKSPEHECNDQLLTSAAQRAISELKSMVKEWGETVANLKQEISRYEDAVKISQRRIDDYDEKINELDQDTESEIDGQEGSTGFSFFGGVGRFFSFHSDIPITNVRLWNDGRGYWVGVEQTQHTYRATLEPHWLNQAYGKVTLCVAKRDKHSAEVSELRKEKEPVVARREKYQRKIDEALRRVATEEGKISDMQTKVATLKRDVARVQTWGHSLPLAQNKTTVKFFTVDSPLAAAAGYKLDATVPWTVPSLEKLSIVDLRSKASAALEEICKAVNSSSSDIKKAEAALACLSGHEGLPIGVFASLIRAKGRGDEEPFVAILSEHREVSELAENALDE